MLREAHTPTNGPRVTKFASVVRRPKNVQEESSGGDDRPRPQSAHRRFGGTPESAAAASTRRHDRRRGAPGSPPPPLRHPIKAEQEPACGENREPYRSRLKPTAFCRSSRPIVLSSSTTEMAKDGGPDWNGLLKWSLAHGDGTNQPRALRSAPRVSRSYASSSFLRLSSSCAKTLTNA